MINLFFDILISSISSFKTSFIVFDMVNKHSFIYILIVSLLVSLFTLNIYNFFIILCLYYLNRYLIKYIKLKELLYIFSYIILFNKNITISSFILLMISIIIIKFNPYNS